MIRIQAIPRKSTHWVTLVALWALALYLNVVAVKALLRTPRDPAAWAFVVLVLAMAGLLIYSSVRNRSVSISDDGITYLTLRGWQTLPWARVRRVERSAIGVLAIPDRGQGIAFPQTIYPDLDAVEKALQEHLARAQPRESSPQDRA